MSTHEHARTTCARAVDRYVQHIKEVYPSREWRNVATILTPLLAHRPLAASSIEEAAKLALANRSHSTSYRRAIHARIRRFAAWAREFDDLRELPTLAAPARLLPTRRSEEPSPPRAEPGDTDAFLKEFFATLPAFRPWARDTLLLLLLTGARPSELLSLRSLDIDTADHPWRASLRTHKTSSTNNAPRVLVFTAQAERIIDRRLKPLCPLEWVFPAQRSPAHHIEPLTLAQHVRRVQTRHRLKRWSPYDLRRCAASIVRQQLTLDAAQALCGHQSPATTARHYARAATHSLARLAAETVAKELSR